MHWSLQSVHGDAPPGVRSHSATLVGSKIFCLGGSTLDDKFLHLYIYDTETNFWYQPNVDGVNIGPHRAHTATLVGNDQLFVFGGGDGPNYFDTLYVLNTRTMTWTQPKPSGTGPGPRRAHTATLVGKNLYFFGGGDGKKALNEIFVLDTEAMAWVPCTPRGEVPAARGYHTSVLYDRTKILVFGGSDGQECFGDVMCFETTNSTWSRFKVVNPFPRLAHSASLCGHMLFTFGGHTGSEYTNEARFLNLKTMEWAELPTTGTPPSPRGYHTSIFLDSRVFIFGGFDNENCFNELYTLDLTTYAYLGIEREK
jgi:N-acetylneuraminic acid mutarotase